MTQLEDEVFRSDNEITQLEGFAFRSDTLGIQLTIFPKQIFYIQKQRLLLRESEVAK